MDTTTEGILKSYIDAFDSFPCDNEKIKAEIEEFKQELTAFAKSTKDFTAFMADYETKGYGKRYIDLFGKIAQSKATELTSEEIEERQRRITPKTFVAQYQTSYDVIKSCRYRKKAEQAYQRLFDLAERSSDILDFNIENEKNNLMFKLAADDAIEQMEFMAQASDPLDKIVYPQFPHLIQSWQKARSDADITYYSEVAQIEISQNSAREQQKMTLITAITLFALGYVQSKHLVLTASTDTQMASGLSGMIRNRNNMRQLFEEILPAFNLDWEKITTDKYYRQLLLAPKSLDALGRIKSCDLPQNVEAISEVIHEEILSNKPIEEMIFRPAIVPITFSISKKTDKIFEKYQKIATEMNKELVYYKHIQGSTSALKLNSKLPLKEF